MENQINHILNVAGILKNFSIAKRVTRSEINKIKKSISTNATTAQEFNDILKEELIKYTDDYIKHHKIPGLIINTNSGLKNFKFKNKRYSKLHKQASMFANSLRGDDSLSKKDIIFFITSLIGCLNLSQQDFEEFNKQISIDSDLEETTDDDDDDDDDDAPEYV